MLSRDVLNALWPEGAFWEPMEDDDYDLLMDGIANNSETVRIFLDKLRYLRDPARTSILDDLEREFAIIPVPGATEAERRERLTVVMFRRGELPTYESLQEKLRAAGFDVYVYPNSPAVDPAIFIEQVFQMTCDDLLPGGNDAQCGEDEAYCGQVGGELLVNGDLYEQAPNYIILCDEADAQCGEDEAQCGNFDSIRLTEIEYIIPDDPGYWPLIFFVGGEAEYSDIAFRSIDFKNTIGYQDWRSVAYGNGVWIAVSSDGTNQIMRSIDDGATWSAILTPENNAWYSVAYGNGVWIAVSINGTNRILRSIDDGISWTPMAATEANAWYSVHYANGVWIAVATNGINRVMRSTDDGATWAPIASAEAAAYTSVAYGNGVWIAVALTGNRIMRSTDNGLTWNTVLAPELNLWMSVYYNEDDGTWIAVASNGTNRVMRSTNDGATWGSVSAAAALSWRSITYGNGVWIAVASTNGYQIMYSIDDGLSWNLYTVNQNFSWGFITFDNDIFVTVPSASLTGESRAMRIMGIATDAISSIDIAPIPIERRLEFRRLILQQKPMCSWAALVVVYQ